MIGSIGPAIRALLKTCIGSIAHVLVVSKRNETIAQQRYHEKATVLNIGILPTDSKQVDKLRVILGDCAG